MADFDPVSGIEDDGYYTPTIKRHSIEKIRIHNYYASLFSTSMRNSWPQRCYLGLYAGAGRARIEGSKEIVETTAFSVLRLRYPFTKHIFVDSDPRCADALRSRIASLSQRHSVTVLQRDVREAVPDIIEAMPTFSSGRGLISFCFVDPFSADLDFSVIKALGTRYRMDFLIALMLGRDVRTNFRRYLEDPSDTRIAGLIDDRHWRNEWADRGLSHRDLIRFLLEKFDDAMTRITYRAARPDDAHPIRVMGKESLPLFAGVLQQERASVVSHKYIDIMADGYHILSIPATGENDASWTPPATVGSVC